MAGGDGTARVACWITCSPTACRATMAAAFSLSCSVKSSMRCHGTSSAAPITRITAAPNSSSHLAASGIRNCRTRLNMHAHLNHRVTASHVEDPKQDSAGPELTARRQNPAVRVLLRRVAQTANGRNFLEISVQFVHCRLTFGCGMTTSQGTEASTRLWKSLSY